MKLRERFWNHENCPEALALLPHQELCQQEGFSVTILENGRPDEDILAKEQLWIKLLSPSINTDLSEANIHDQYKLEMCLKMKVTEGD